MSKSRRKRKPPRRVLAPPYLEQAKLAVLNSLTSRSGQRTYDHAIDEFVEWPWGDISGAKPSTGNLAAACPTAFQPVVPLFEARYHK